MAVAKSIVVDLNRQVLIAYEGTAPKYEFDCASGDSSHPTPVGKLKIQSKHRDYTSHKYKVAMNFAMFFTNTEAIHESHAVGLTAATLFDWTPVHTPVEIKSA